KIGAIYSAPGGRISLRASYGTSFLAPTLFQQFTSSSNIANISDIGPGVRGQDAIRRVTILLQGNPDLAPQRSTAWAVGGVVEPIKNFRIDIGYWHYKFTDLITQENTQALVTANDPVKVIRDGQNNVIFVKPSYVNLANLETSGLDITASYRHDLGRYGQLNANWNSTFVPQFDLRSGPTARVVKGAGNRNSIITGGVASPRWRGLGQLTWTIGDHSLTTLIHYYGGINNDTTVSTPGLTKSLDDWYLAGVTTFDLSYTYSPGRIWKAERTSLTLGVQNLFQSKPETPFNTAPSFVDPRGRIAYFRLVAGF
ncbi:MAG: TonB-dependent receptor, partial [Caulobacteraceae bacterium]